MKRNTYMDIFLAAQVIIAAAGFAFSFTDLWIYAIPIQFCLSGGLFCGAWLMYKACAPHTASAVAMIDQQNVLISEQRDLIDEMQSALDEFDNTGAGRYS